MQKRLEHLDEAQNELMLVDEEDSTRFLVGECFLHIDNEDADTRINDGVKHNTSVCSPAPLGISFVMRTAQFHFSQSLNLIDTWCVQRWICCAI